MRVASQGRQGREIHDELVDEIGAVPTVFEEAYPFEWPETPVVIQDHEMEFWSAGTPGHRPDGLEYLDNPDYIREGSTTELEPLSDEELVDFWAKQTQEPKRKRRH
jgi:hypothetical protein